LLFSYVLAAYCIAGVAQWAEGDPQPMSPRMGLWRRELWQSDRNVSSLKPTRTTIENVRCKDQHPK